MSKSYLEKDDIIKLIDKNDWNLIYKNIFNNKIQNPNEILINGNNLFHIACIRTQTEFIEKIYKLCNDYLDIDSNLTSNTDLSGYIKNRCSVNTEIQNEEGYPGIHLYYKYGGTSKKLLQLDSVCYLDRDYRGMINYLIESIDLLEIYIRSTIEKSCLPDIELVGPDSKIKYNIYYLLINHIKKIEKDTDTDKKSNKNLIVRYLEIIKLLILNLSGSNRAIFYVIYMKSYTVLDYLISEKLINPYAKNSRGETPLIMAVSMGDLKIVKQLLDAYENIKVSDLDKDYIDIEDNKLDTPSNISGSGYTILDYITQYRMYSDDRPINICIKIKRFDMLDELIKHLKKYRKKTNVKSYHLETDEYNSTYLHNLLRLMNNKEIINTSEDGKMLESTTNSKLSVSLSSLSYLIKYTDINQVNYFGYSSAHMLFIGKLWKNDKIKEMIEGKEIDLLKTDINNKNIYSYVSKKDKEEFMDMTKNIVLKINTNLISINDNEIKELTEIINVIDRDKLLSKKEYGLFYPTPINYMLFMLYLKNKHSNLFIPHRFYNSKKKKYEQYVMNMTSYPLSEMQSILNAMEQMNHSRFYSYTPHMVNWYDKNLYYVNPELVEILTEQNTKDTNQTRRFIMLKILIILSGDAHHANCLVYDKKKKEAWRFESYGLTDLAKDAHILDKILKSIMESVYGKIKYHSPSEYLSNIKFQLVDNEDDIRERNLGDPGGYCLAWSIWFVDIICSNTESDKTDINYLMKHYITNDRLENIFNLNLTSDEQNNKSTKSNLNRIQNIYLEYIRQYGHFLDTKKNEILSKIGVSSSDFYSMIVGSDALKKIIDSLKEGGVDY
jgi:ankyrin repeat protein